MGVNTTHDNNELIEHVKIPLCCTIIVINFVKRLTNLSRINLL